MDFTLFWVYKTMAKTKSITMDFKKFTMLDTTTTTSTIQERE